MYLGAFFLLRVAVEPSNSREGGAVLHRHIMYLGTASLALLYMLQNLLIRDRKLATWL